MGVIAHTPFTVSPVFAARVEAPDCTPVLRLYEWERIRRAAYQIDAYLPDGSRRAVRARQAGQPVRPRHFRCTVVEHRRTRKPRTCACWFLPWKPTPTRFRWRT